MNCINGNTHSHTHTHILRVCVVITLVYMQVKVTRQNRLACFENTTFKFIATIMTRQFGYIVAALNCL
jgi:hypothetical protein